jgi:hypothetical protein
MIVVRSARLSGGRRRSDGVVAVAAGGVMTDDEVLALYERSVDDLYRYATRLTGGDRAWADELVHETYLSLLRRVRRGERRLRLVDRVVPAACSRHFFTMK